MITILEYSPWLCWIIPYIGAVLSLLFHKFHHKLRDVCALASSFLAAIFSTLIIFAYPNVLKGGAYHSTPILSVKWIDAPGVTLKAGLLVDPLSVFMANVVAWISFLIMVYSLGYMEGDRGIARYWFFMNLFIGNMLLLVLSDNFIQIMFGWEGVGLCSYALIGHWYEDDEKERRTKWVGEGVEEYAPSHCGMKAFITTRLGDVGLLLAVFIIFSQSGTFNLIELGKDLGWASKLSNLGLLIPTALLFLLGPIGKSAQFPLMEWLPDAMAGPAPVSALIHAATMVKAGVYLIARVFPIFYLLMQSGFTELRLFFASIMWIGAITAFISATQASVSSEIKKVWAYSTVSQIGYMMISLGVAGYLVGDAVVAAYVAALFHLLSHALFKATLFLTSGSVIHSCESRFMRDMGGLSKFMPITSVATLIGVLALAGVPPLGGFWSKEGILKAIEYGMYKHVELAFIFVIASVTAIITVFYSLRTYILTFIHVKSVREAKHHNNDHDRDDHHHMNHHPHQIHEAKAVMWLPYILLAASIIVVGFGVPFGLEGNLHHTFEDMLSHYLIHVSKDEGKKVVTGYGYLPIIASIVSLFIGSTVSYLLYVKKDGRILESLKNVCVIKMIQRFFFNRWYMNRAWYVIADRLVVLSRIIHDRFESPIVDGFNYMIADRTVRISNRLRKIHTGVLNDYLIGAVLGMIMLITFLIIVLRF
ncbi:MAG: NADH-quinone oxidoreductase subunit L [Nitrososphaerota archaeon]|nr:NADH-quinone oxidoreductase subunit L [Nitrososphaerota archaeon]